MMQFSQVPKGSVLGLNYSGMHDSSIALVAPDGDPVFAVSLERFTRIKQDGRPPRELLENIPWDRIASVAVSTENSFHHPAEKECQSMLLTTILPNPRGGGLTHGKEFAAFLDEIPCRKDFVPHQIAHAASSFWGSGFEEALCLTYDGGMANSPWFGGLYRSSQTDGIHALDQFSALNYAKVTTLYTFVTALMGFTPNKHEGKVTGLAAYGRPSIDCRKLLSRWFGQSYFEIEQTMRWVFAYDSIQIPSLIAEPNRIQPFLSEAAVFSREELAATLQEFTERHLLDILSRANCLGWKSERICLSGGLFANVKINQRIAESGFKEIFVSPPMTDDGTALGAAWQVLSRQKDFKPRPIRSMFLGPDYSEDKIAAILEKENVIYSKTKNPAETIAAILAQDKVVAVFQGRMEFGPRALGNRSILAQATREQINLSLNQRLNRTEFMPFAPVTRIEDADLCYIGIKNVSHATEFMTVTCKCTELMRKKCPAVVHADGTARPQLVNSTSHPLIHEILTNYHEKTGNPALVNTSFNIHEEPIVCSPEDALKGFFESGLDYLYFASGYLISFNANKDAALRYLQKKQRYPHALTNHLKSLIALKSQEMNSLMKQVQEKEVVIREVDESRIAAQKEIFNLEIQLRIKKKALEEASIHLASEVENNNKLKVDVSEKDKLNAKLLLEIRAWKLSGFFMRPLQKAVLPIIKAKKELTTVKLGTFFHHEPQAFYFTVKSRRKKIHSPPTIAIVTPSYNQGNYLSETIRSVISQKYPALQYVVQDGDSTDNSREIIKKFSSRLYAWNSKPDSGQANAINLGFQKTSGEIMAWLNADDLYLPDTLWRVAQFFHSNPGVDVVYGHRLIIDKNSHKIGAWILPKHDDTVLDWADYVPQETMFWRRGIWEKTGGRLDESFDFALDWELLQRFKTSGAKIYRIHELLGCFRVHGAQKTGCEIGKRGKIEMDIIRRKAHGRVPQESEIYANIKGYLRQSVRCHFFWELHHGIKKRALGRKRIVNLLEHADVKESENKMFK